MSYALAKVCDEALLFKGQDFSQTDIHSGIERSCAFSRTQKPPSHRGDRAVLGAWLISEWRAPS